MSSVAVPRRQKGGPSAEIVATRSVIDATTARIQAKFAPAPDFPRHCKITIRQPKPLKAKIAEAAALRSMTVTSFINGMLEIAAERTLRRIETRELTDRDSAALLVMLHKPPAPKAALNAHIRTSLGQHGRRDLTRGYVAVDAANRVVGYFTLAAGRLSVSVFPERGGLPAKMPLPTTLLARLAVARAWQGRGIGAALLAYALHVAVDAARSG